jgi:hypothetical protein
MLPIFRGNQGTGGGLLALGGPVDAGSHRRGQTLSESHEWDSDIEIRPVFEPEDFGEASLPILRCSSWFGQCRRK